MTNATTIPTLETTEAATAMLRGLAESHEWVSVFWDRGWGDAPLEISIIVDGNGQHPKALITPDVYQELRDQKVIPANTLKTFKKRRLHNYKTPPEDETDSAVKPVAVAEQVVRDLMAQHPEWPVRAEFYRGLDPNSRTPRVMHDVATSDAYDGTWFVMILPGAGEYAISAQEPSVLGPAPMRIADCLAYPRQGGEVDVDALAGVEFRAELAREIEAKLAEIEAAKK